VDLAMTTEADLGTARALAREMGLLYVYIGNALLPGATDTACPKCGTVVLVRRCGQPPVDLTEGGRCPKCGEMIAGVGLGRFVAAVR